MCAGVIGWLCTPPKAAVSRQFPKGLDGRMRDEDGQIRAKNGTTKIGHIEEKYGVDLGARSDMLLENYLDKFGYDSMSEAIRDHR
jgi:hypothetical protein